jgi:glycosyltransferase involved in cell wall biosynthesis
MVAPVTEAGIGVWLSNVCPILEKNHELTLLTSDFPGGVPIQCKNILKLQTWKFPNSLYRYMPKLKDLLSQGFFDNYDIIHLNGFTVFPTYFILKNRDKIKSKIILSVHGNLQEHKKKLLRLVYDKFALRYIHEIDHVIAVSDAEKTQLIKLGFPKNNVTVGINGVKFIEIKRKQKEKLVLYLGRLASSKNIELLIESFSLCKVIDSKLLIAGPDYGTLKNLKQITKKLNLENRVSFLGKISESEKYSLLSRVSVFVHPSISDIFALTLLESASAGIPCIAFNVGGNKEIFSEPKTGYLVDSITPDSLAKAIDEILSNKELAHEISVTGQKHIMNKFSWEKTTEKIEYVYTHS